MSKAKSYILPSEPVMAFPEFLQWVEGVIAGENHLSFSALKHLLDDGPFGLMWYKCAPKEDKSSYEMGRIFEDLLLLPDDEFGKKYEVVEGDGRKKEVKEAIRKAEGAGKKVLRGKNWEEAKRRYGRAMYNPEIVHLVSSTTWTQGKVEYMYAGIKILGYFDMKGPYFTADVKVMSNTTIERIKWQLRDMRYHMQGAMYLHETKSSRYYLLCSVKGGACVARELAKPTLEEGWKMFEEALLKFKRVYAESSADEEVWFCGPEFFEDEPMKL